MVATTQDLMVPTEADFYRLPEDGVFEVVHGRAMLLPGHEIPHQDISGALYEAFRRRLKARGSGYVFQTVNVFVPPTQRWRGEIQNRVPDLAVSTRHPAKHFPAGEPPELVIEILSTRRGNVERTEKMDDYARAGIAEYWIVNPIDRVFEVYRLQDGDYALQPVSQLLQPQAFPGVEIDPQEIWSILD